MSPTVHRVARSVLDEVGRRRAGDPHDPRCFIGLHVDRHRIDRQQLAHARDGVAHHLAADVIRVVVGGQRADESHVVRREDVEQSPDVVRGIDGDGFAGLSITDQIDEVDHLRARSDRRCA